MASRTQRILQLVNVINENNKEDLCNSVKSADKETGTNEMDMPESNEHDVPSFSHERVQEQQTHSIEETINRIDNPDFNSESVLHITADSTEFLHRTPEREEEFSDFDNDDEVADPDYLGNNDDDQDDVEENNSDEEDVQQNDNSRKNTGQVKKQSRKRQSNPKMWKKNLTKTKRYSGVEYTTDSGSRIIEPRKMKEPCNDTCKLLCKTKISEETRQVIHDNFWNPTKSINVRRQFIASRVEQIPIKRNRERTGKRSGKRTFSNSYSFETGGIKQTVCRSFFLNTLSISQQTVETAIKKKKDGGIVTPDKRDKHEPFNKISEEVRNSIRNHISKFPTYESHYSRERSKKRYLGNHLNISKMYALYLEECKEHGVETVNIGKEWLYSEIFNYEYNYSFKSPDNDTCDLCDAFKLQLQEAESAESRTNVQKQYDEHLLDAENRYRDKSNDKMKARAKLLEEKVVMIDLQKCLPTPDLHNSQSFYSLKLWTFNLTIHDSTLEKSYCMMWDESVAGRGGNEMASCFIKWVEHFVSDSVQELTIWSDNCPSQNRNILMVMCHFWILHLKPTLKVVNHKFLARGHTHQEADAVHSVIERERKKVPQFHIMTPWDWQQIARVSGAKKQFTVMNMETSDFKDFKQLFDGQRAPYINKKKNTKGEDFLISQVRHLQVRQDNPGILYYKTVCNEEFLEIDFNRKTRRSESVRQITISPIRDGPKPISTKKYNHLQNLLKWVPKRFHPYYNTLIHGNNDGDDGESL